MTTLVLGYRSIQSKVTSLSSKRINWKIVYLSGILFAVSMLVSYIFLVNQLTGGTYLIKSYDKEINLLSKENSILEVNSTHDSLLGQVMKKANELSFEKTKDIKYVQILESSLAKAK